MLLSNFELYIFPARNEMGHYLAHTFAEYNILPAAFIIQI